MRGPGAAGRRVPFGLIAGGLLCANCRAGKKQIVSLSSEVVVAMRRMADPAGEDRPAPLARGVQGELRGLLNRYLTHLVGQPLEMHRYLSPQDARRPAADQLASRHD